jgi:putative DNA-invertase from lambdoid prophage Rac
MRVGLYERVSTHDQQPQLQIDALQAMAKQRGWTVVWQGCDVGSGRNFQRPKWRELNQLAFTGQLDAIAVWKLDRCGRSLPELARTLREWADQGVRFVSATEAIDTSTASGALLGHVLGAVAQFESDVIAERTRAGMAAAKRQGKHLGRPQASPGTVAAVRHLHALGLSYRRIIDILQPLPVGPVSAGLIREYTRDHWQAPFSDTAIIERMEHGTWDRTTADALLAARSSVPSVAPPAPRKPGRPPLPAGVRDAIRHMVACGLPYRSIAERLAISKSTVQLHRGSGHPSQRLLEEEIDQLVSTRQMQPTVAHECRLALQDARPSG